MIKKFGSNYGYQIFAKPVTSFEVFLRTSPPSPSGRRTQITIDKNFNKVLLLLFQL